jgi:hypothetical protein
MSNIVAEYKFDDGSGTIIYDTWKGNNGTWYGSTSGITIPSWKNNSDCVLGGCLYFDGIDDYIFIANNTEFYPSPNMTISFWAKPVTSATSGSMFGKYNGAGGGTQLWTYGFWNYSSGNLGFGIGNGTSSNFTSNIYTMSMDNWYHIVVNYIGSSNVVKYYINGQYISAKDLTLTMTPVVSTNGYYIGSSGGNLFKGTIDDLRIFNSAMPTSWIKNEYFLGVNSLLNNKAISFEEYFLRIKELSSIDFQSY